MSVERPRASRFALTFWSVVVVLAVVVVGFGAVSMLRAPRIVATQQSDAALVDRAGGRIQLQFDQAVDASSLEDLTVTPAAGHEVAVDGRVVTVTFSEPLRYATAYALEFADLAGVATGARGDADFRFETVDPDIFTLERSGTPSVDGADVPVPGARGDTIIRRSLTGTSSETVFTASRIQDYTVVGPVLVVVVILDDGTNAIETLSLDTGARAEIPLPSAGTVRELHGNPTRSIVGYTFTTGVDAPAAIPRHSNTLFTYDLTDQAGNAATVPSVDGSPIEALDWMFVPATTSVIAQTADQEVGQIVLLADILDPGALRPLGQHAELRGFLPGTRMLVVADPDGGSLIDTTTGTSEPLVLPESGVGEGAEPGPIVMLGADSYARVYSDHPDGRAEPRSVVVGADQEGSRILYAPADDRTRIVSMCGSPNGTLLAVETVSVEGEGDGYPRVQGFGATTAVVVDVVTGEIVRSAPGMFREWCV